MRNYDIAIANTYNALNSPLIINAGYYNTKISGYKCITKLKRDEYKIVPYDDNILIIDDITFLVNKENNYTVFLHDYSQTDNPPVPFNFYAFQNVYEVNNEIINFILTQEFPTLYKNTNSFTAINNAGNVAVLLRIYATIYALFYNATTSLGINKTYSSEWEYVYLGINQVLQNAAYPAQFLKTLMNVNTQTSTQVFSLAITFSRLFFQLTNIQYPIQIIYDNVFEGYHINIFSNSLGVWALGIYGELDVTTILSGEANAFLSLLTRIIIKLMPAFVKWELHYLSLTDFETDFNVTDVGEDDYYDAAILYDAYMVVNNNNNFNVKGYNLNG